jgi:5-hydroxyisourate hydrolase-like protein (transthyretin family)
LLFALAERNSKLKSVSVHVLSPEDGLPSPEVNVALEKLDSKTWGVLNSGVTNEQDHVPLLRSSYSFSTYRGNRCLGFETSD